MPGEFPRSPRLLKGALVAYDQPILGPIPNIIVLQYNPDQLTRTLRPRGTPRQSATTGEPKQDTLLTPGPPNESISLAVELDATDQLEAGNRIALERGIQPALAALELLMYPKSREVRSNAQAAVRGTASLKPESLPVVLFVWGKARVVPVRVTSCTVTEQAFDQMLNPIRARVDLGLQVLTYIDLPEDNLGAQAFNAMQVQREVLAGLNLVSSAETVLGLLPV
jgi:hypothetical protein